jgi:hypothetical protein
MDTMRALRTHYVSAIGHCNANATVMDSGGPAARVDKHDRIVVEVRTVGVRATTLEHFQILFAGLSVISKR